ncbi:MAG: hypothetical protein P0Y65_01555 [Candidatus Devosia phytovorans]|uniref:Uncharacterized protein n=1 Tax=Candidatus Devosia phytovorans TaxID=3121372 RepID=A0AAJ5VVQ0_9HYPH|nr:hypothetical protein [Devosia sp.]WEK04966.1 MAG: hypothetical protein P0Y65_01555 [Devosia sp.]
MTISSQSAVALINSELQSVQSAAVQSRSAAFDASDFCSLWPTAKPILQLLSSIAFLIPGVGAGAGAVLAGLIKVGDQIHADTCGA